MFVAKATGRVFVAMLLVMMLEWTVLVKGLSRVQEVFRGVMCEFLLCKKRMNRVEVK